jgi:hypothetical protein
MLSRYLTTFYGIFCEKWHFKEMEGLPMKKTITLLGVLFQCVVAVADVTTSSPIMENDAYGTILSHSTWYDEKGNLLVVVDLADVSGILQPPMLTQLVVTFSGTDSAIGLSLRDQIGKKIKLVPLSNKKIGIHQSTVIYNK